MVEIFFKAKESLIADLVEKTGSWITVISFFGGIFIIVLIDKLIPSYENPHEIKKVEAMNQDAQIALKNEKLKKMGLFTALAIAIHNFPEGLATFTAALSDPTLGIAIHNIPEGIAVSVPIYYATGNKRKAFWHSFA